MKKLRPFDWDKYKIRKNKQKLKKNVRAKSVCEKYKGKVLKPIKIILLKEEYLLKSKSLNSSLINSMFNIHIAGLSKKGAISANKKRSDISTKADRDRNFRSSNTNHTNIDYAYDSNSQNVTISDCFSFCKLSIESVI